MILRKLFSKIIGVARSNLNRLRPSIKVRNSKILCGSLRLGEDSRVIDSFLSGKLEFDEGVLVKGCNIHGLAKVGRYTRLNGPNIFINSKLNKVSIGSFCSIAMGVVIQEYNHYLVRPSTYFMNQNFFCLDMQDDIHSKGGVEIGHDVWIGANAIVTSGIKIGNGAVIGAGSVVTRDIEPYAIAVGNPAKVIRYRFSKKTIHFLEEKKWWDWDLKEIHANKEFFLQELQ